MAITLQSTVGGFSPEFMRKLPLVEQAMIAHGLEPAQFVISKDRAGPHPIPLHRAVFLRYTVFIGEENFTVTEPNDMTFLDYFYKRCIAAEEPRRSSAAGGAARSAASSAGWRSRSEPRVIPGRASARTRNLARIISGFRVHRCAMPRNDEDQMVGTAQGRLRPPCDPYSPHCRASVASAQPSQ